MTSRYSETELQVALADLAVVFVELLGIDGCEVPDNLDESWSDYLVSINEYEIGIEDLVFRLESMFHAKIDKETWVWWHFGETLPKGFLSSEHPRRAADVPSIRGMVIWALDHSFAASMEPISVAGKVCAAAGVFTGLRAIAGCVKREDARIGPSTPLADYFDRSSDLSAFWFYVSLSCNVRLPNLPVRSDGWFLAVIGVSTVVFSCIVLREYVAAFWIAMVMSVPILALFRCEREIYERARVPKNVVTFGDLSKYIASRMEVVVQ